jgi:protein gp37
MGKDTKISWTRSTFNPWWGCTKVAPECKECYAAAFDHRVGGDHWGPGKPRRTFGEKHWQEPYRWDAEAKAEGCEGGDGRWTVFEGSMCDVMDDEAPAAERSRHWKMIRETPHLTHLLLTKRPENFAKYLPDDWGEGYPNVWIGTSAGTKESAEKNLPHLARTRARLRFVSGEPLLEAVDFRQVLFDDECPVCGGLGCRICKHTKVIQRAAIDRIDWIIVGGESGHRRRPMELDWVRSIRDQCADNAIAFFYKQRMLGQMKIETPHLDGVRHVAVPRPA